MMADAVLPWEAVQQRPGETAREHTGRVHELIRSAIISSILRQQPVPTLEDARRVASEIQATIRAHPSDPLSAIVEWELPNRENG